MHVMHVVWVIFYREILRFLREKKRVVAGFAMPLVFFLIGIGLDAGLGEGLRFNYLQFMFPGVIGMTIMMTALYQSLSVVYDRELGFLKEMLVAPIPRWPIILGKTLGISVLAFSQGFLMLFLAPLADISLSFELFLYGLPIIAVLAISISSFGVALASRIHSMQTYFVVMPIPMIVMMFLGGAIFPLRNLPVYLDIPAKINPLTFGIDLMRRMFLSRDVSPETLSALTTFSWQIDVAVIVLFSVFMIIFASVTFREE